MHKKHIHTSDDIVTVTDSDLYIYNVIEEQVCFGPAFKLQVWLW
mgnify:CR=1 FL=1